MLEIDEIICRSLKGQTSLDEERHLASWRRAAEQNEAYYRDLLRLLEAAESSALDVATPPPPPVAALISPMSSRQPQARATRWRRLRHYWATGAFALAAAAALATLLLGTSERAPATAPQAPFSLGEGEFVTGSAETATVVLGDGTIVRLGPESRLRIAGIPGSREVSLAGRAYFAVAKMEGVPFRVRTQAGEAVVLGTRFEVRTEGDDLRLVVVEGRVALQAEGRRVEVQAGEMSVVSEGTTSAPVKVRDPNTLIEWMERFVVFQSTPLKEVAETLEKEYGVRIEVADGEFAAQTITGWYADRRFEEVLTVICSALQAKCSMEGGVARIRP
jgi:transmembrane sensor